MVAQLVNTVPLAARKIAARKTPQSAALASESLKITLEDKLFFPPWMPFAWPSKASYRPRIRRVAGVRDPWDFSCQQSSWLVLSLSALEAPSTQPLDKVLQCNLVLRKLVPPIVGQVPQHSKQGKIRIHG